MGADHYSRKIDRSGAGWSIIQGLGRTGSSVTVLQQNVESITQVDDIISNSPVLEYDFYAFTKDEAMLRLNCIPSLSRVTTIHHLSSELSDLI